MRFGFLSGKKKQAQEPPEHEPAENMDWDNVYVEIDNDANVPIINGAIDAERDRISTEQTERRSGSRTLSCQNQTSHISASVSASRSTTYDSRGTSTFATKSYTMRGDEEDQSHGATLSENQSTRLSASASGSTMYDSRATSTFETKSYTMQGNEEDQASFKTPSASNKTNKSLQSDEYFSFSRNRRSAETPVLSNVNSGTTFTVREEDPTINSDDLPDHHLQYPQNSIVQNSITQGGKYLSNNHFANAQLIRWKHAAEEGPVFIQFMAVSMAIGTMFTTIYPLVVLPEFWSVPFGISAFHTTMLCCLILAFDMRACGDRNPMSLRGRIRSLLIRYLPIFRVLWGRGLLYIFTGSMNLTITYYPYTFYTGCILMTQGIFAILTGTHAAYHLDRLRLSMTDSSFLWCKFVEADSDSDNMIDISDFSNLLWSLGLEMSDEYTYRVFLELDKDSDKRIVFPEFETWWIASQDGDETVLSMDHSKILRSQSSEKTSNDSGA
eukprot:jgi/Psemu1/36260/gm1.36260_g